jgi:hypothetical protein
MNDIEVIKKRAACPDCDSTVTVRDLGTAWDVQAAHDPTCLHIPEQLRRRGAQ